MKKDYSLSCRLESAKATEHTALSNGGKQKRTFGAPSVRKMPQTAVISKLILLNGAAISVMPLFVSNFGWRAIFCWAIFQSA